MYDTSRSINKNFLRTQFFFVNSLISMNKNLEEMYAIYRMLEIMRCHVYGLNVCQLVYELFTFLYSIIR